MVKMKHFVDIDRLREGNSLNFVKGDHIIIQTKIDGANASATWEDGQVKCFSRKKECSASNTLRGFWNFIQELNPSMFSEHINWVFFGEWLVKHTINYNDEAYGQWYVYDIYDKTTEQYLPQNIVKRWCEVWNMNYIETLYDGEFIDWEHVKRFLHSSKMYGDEQEGIVVKNETRLSLVEDSRQPSYIKIVNSEFCETKAHKGEKTVDLNKIQGMANATDIISTIVTEARVRKEINKMIDEGILPTDISPRDMGIVAKNLPKRIIDDCMKEERETFLSAGEYAGKVSSQLTMMFARKIILGE